MTGAILRRLTDIRKALPLATLYITSSAWLVMGTAAQLVSFVVLARVLGVEQFGQLMAITAATHLGTHLCGLGAGEGMVRRTARRLEDYAAMAGHNIILMAASGIVLCVTITAGVHFYLPATDDSILSVGVIAAFVVANVVLFRWILFTEQVFIAHWKIGRANTVNVGFAFAKAATTLIACFVFDVDTVSEWALWYLGVHALGAALCALALIPFGRPKWVILRDELRLGIHFSTPWFFLTLRNNIDLLALSIVASPAVVGAYSVVKRVVETSKITSSSLNRLLYPRLARAGKEGCHAALAMILNYMLPIVAVAAASAAALFAMAPFLPLLVGDQFDAAVLGIQILGWSLIVTAIKDAAFDTLGAADEHRVRAMAYNGGSIAAVFIIAFFTYHFAVEGAFFAIYLTKAMIGVLLWAVLVSVSRRRRDGRLQATHEGSSA